MSRTHRIYFPIAVLLIAGIACAAPSATATPEIGSVGYLNTAIVQTVAALTLNAPTQTPIPTETSTPTLAWPTLTPTETITLTAEFTPTASITLVSVSVPTNCRSGPGKIYETQGSLLVGESAEVFGVDPTNMYWYIRNPDVGTTGVEFCWVWGEYATFTGFTSQLPIYTPQPTPTATLTALYTSTPVPTKTSLFPPSFTGVYVSLDSCNGNWWAKIKIKNDGLSTFRSAFISARDTVTKIVQAKNKDGFAQKNGCEESNTKETLAVGETYLLSTPSFNYDLSGHEMKVTITLCSETGQKGLCTSRTVGFIP